MEKLPGLNAFGVGLYNHGRGKTPEERERETAEGKAALRRDVDGCTRAAEWLSRWGRTESINSRQSSYTYKHWAEDVTGGYLTNGALIAAAIHLGFQVKRDGLSPNVFLNISQRSLNPRLHAQGIA
ncbi:MAG TPA: hypothetical protein VHI52_22215 [Verrucomicrobiae bacterium]|nr:hypothetical protein [Verrucomicrobiae bacterium]